MDHGGSRRGALKSPNVKPRYDSTDKSVSFADEVKAQGDKYYPKTTEGFYSRGVYENGVWRGDSRGPSEGGDLSKSNSGFLDTTGYQSRKIVNNTRTLTHKISEISKGSAQAHNIKRPNIGSGQKIGDRIIRHERFSMSNKNSDSWGVHTRKNLGSLFHPAHSSSSVILNERRNTDSSFNSTCPVWSPTGNQNKNLNSTTHLQGGYGHQNAFAEQFNPSQIQTPVKNGFFGSPNYAKPQKIVAPIIKQRKTDPSPSYNVQLKEALQSRPETTRIMSTDQQNNSGVNLMNITHTLLDHLENATKNRYEGFYNTAEPKSSADDKNVPGISVDLGKPLKNTEFQKLQGKITGSDKKALTNLFLVESARKDSAKRLEFFSGRKDSDKLTGSEPGDLDLAITTPEVAPTKKDVLSARRPNMGRKPPVKKLELGKIAAGGKPEDGRQSSGRQNIDGTKGFHSLQNSDGAKGFQSLQNSNGKIPSPRDVNGFYITKHEDSWFNDMQKTQVAKEDPEVFRKKNIQIPGLMKNLQKTGNRPDSGGNKYLSGTESDSSPGILGKLDFEKVNSDMFVSQNISIKKGELEKIFNGKKKLNFEKKHKQEVVNPKVEVVNVAILNAEESKLKYSLSPLSQMGDLGESNPNSIAPEKIVVGVTRGPTVSTKVERSPSEKYFMVNEQPSIRHAQDIARLDSGLEPSPSKSDSIDKEISTPTQIQPLRGVSPIQPGLHFGGSDQSDMTLPFNLTNRSNYQATNREQDVLLETPADTTKAPINTSYYVEHPSLKAKHEDLGLNPLDQTQPKGDSPYKEIFAIEEEEALGLTERRLEN